MKKIEFKNFKKLKYLIIIPFVLLGCKKDIEKFIAFSDWIKDGNYSIFKCYNSLPPGTADSLTIKFSYREVEKDFYMEYLYWGGVDSINYIGGHCYVTISSEGLFKGWSCETSAGDQLLAPCKPKLNQTWIYYNCFNDFIGQFRIVDIDKEISIPAGTFNTFVIRDTYYNRNAYYNLKYGIIKLESVASDNSTVLSSFDLVAKNYY